MFTVKSYNTSFGERKAFIKGISFLHECFSRLLNCTNSATLRKASYMKSK